MNTKRNAVAIASLAVVAAFAPLATAPLFAQAPARTLSTEVREGIRKRVESGRGAEQMIVAGDTLWLPVITTRFYEPRDFQPAWTVDGTARAAADSLLAMLKRVGEDGLLPKDYHVVRLQALLEAVRGEDVPSPDDLAELDLLLTDGYAAYASHLVAGRLDPVTLTSRADPDPEGLDLAGRLERALAADDVQRDLVALLDGSDPGYRRLRTSLTRYRSLARDWGGWVELRRLLAATGDYSPPTDEVAGLDDEPVFDAALELAVRRFQARHGLPETGAIGPRTRAALAVTPGQRARQIELNLERWRWLPRELGRRFVLVNIAGFMAEAVEGGQTKLSMRAIVGTQYRQTPVLSDTITYVVFNPSWRVPRDIVRRELLPLIREDPEYLSRENLHVIGAEGREIDPASIDWDAVVPSRIPWRLEQEPGPRNALGPVKLMFPNPYEVYLHGTPERELFQHSVRAFSHGCIRLERPLELARYLLDSGDWNEERIGNVLASGRETTAPVADPVPIYIEYWTAWAEPDGTVHFRDDIYERDRALDRAFARSQ